MGGETEAQRDKGQPGGGTHEVLWSSLSAVTAVPGRPCPCSVGAGVGRGPQRITWADSDSAEESAGPANKGLVGGKKEGLGAAAHLPGGAAPLLVAVFDGTSDPHCTPLPGTQRGPTYACTQCRGAAHGSPGLRLLRVWSWAEAPAKPCPAFWRGRGGFNQERGWGLPRPETRPRGDSPGKATITTAREVAADTASLCWYNSASHGSATRRAVFPISQMRTWRPRQVE